MNKNHDIKLEDTFEAPQYFRDVPDDLIVFACPVCFAALDVPWSGHKNGCPHFRKTDQEG